MIAQYTYLNTLSEAGRPVEREINQDSITHINVWINSYGNPTYMYHMDNGDTHLLVDDYGAMNGINHISANSVARRKCL